MNCNSVTTLKLFNTREDLILSMPPGCVVAEIGVFRGKNAEVILHSRPKELHLIDGWAKQTGSYAIDPVNEKDLEEAYKSVREKFSVYPWVKVVRAWSLEAAKGYADEYFDWIYLDGDHTFDAVRADLEAWWPKVKSGGCLFGHDYVAGEKYPWIEVKPAVDWFINKYRRDLAFLTTKDEYLSYGIRK